MTPDLQNLAERIAALERQEHAGRQQASPVEMPGWGDVLLGGKLAAGALVELLAAEEGAGAWTLALFMAGHACGRRKILVVADGDRRFYPPAASRLSIDLRRTLVIRPKQGQAALAAMAQSLRCAAVGAALGRLERLSATDCRRLQVAAESGGGVGFLLRPASALTTPSFANVRLLVTPLAAASADLVRRIQVEVVRCRGGLLKPDHVGLGGFKTGTGPLVLEIDDEKGHVRLPASMAAAKPSAPSA